jgi:hypothetical protein
MTTNVCEIQSGKKPFSLEIRWHSRLSLLDGEKWQKPLTQKERGQLKNLANALGPLTNEVMDWALENWSDFASTAATQSGVNGYPSAPHIGFLLAHCGVAVNQMHSSAEAKKRQAEKQKEIEAANQKREIEKAAKAAQLEKDNQEAIEEMYERFAAAGEPRPPIEYNYWGQVIYQVTQEHLAALRAEMAALKEAALKRR